MNALAVVSASPSAWWGSSPGCPSSCASRASDSPAGARPVAPAQPQAAQRLRVGVGRQPHPAAAQLPPQEAALHDRGVEHRDATRQRVQQQIDRLGAARRVREIGGAELVHQHRGVLGRALGTSQRVHRLAQDQAAVVHGHRPDRDDLIGAGVQSGQLEVDHQPVGLAPRDVRPGLRGLVKSSRRPPRTPAPEQPHGRSSRVTALTARNTSRRWLRVSGLISAGSSRSSGASPAASCSS